MIQCTTLDKTANLSILNKMHPLFQSQLLIATLTGCLSCAILTHVTHAFEQSNYFIFDIIESQETEAVQNRLALPAAALTKMENAPQSSTQRQTVRSEFEIDFNQAIQSSGHNAAAFTFDQAIKAPSEPASSFNTDSFDLGTSHTEFGK